MKFYFVISVLLLQITHILAQSDTDHSKVYNFGGSISANTNGFSLVPTFSLGKPALQTGLNLSAPHSRLSFHPQIWYSLLDYKPWSFIFIWRYKVVNNDKLSFMVGTHAPAINFKSGTVIDGGLQKDVIKARRFYPALELTQSFKLTKSTSVGFYYILGSGIETEIATINNFVSFRADFNNITLTENFFMRFNPQFYFLSIDRNTGIYASGGIAFGKKSFPFTLSSNFNKAIKTNIDARPFDWNVGLNYEFANQFEKKKG